MFAVLMLINQARQQYLREQPINWRDEKEASLANPLAETVNMNCEGLMWSMWALFLRLTGEDKELGDKYEEPDHNALKMAMRGRVLFIGVRSWQLVYYPGVLQPLHFVS